MEELKLELEKNGTIREELKKEVAYIKLWEQERTIYWKQQQMILKKK